MPWTETRKIANLKTVANAQDGNAVREHVRVHTGSVDIVDGVGRAGEDDPCSEANVSKSSAERKKTERTHPWAST